MKRFRLPIAIVVVALITIAVLLLGRQAGEDQADGPAPASGGVYIEGLIGAPSRFNPILEAFNPVDADVNSLIYSSLLKHDSWGHPQPDLAESWGVSVSGDIFNVTLRENATWHDGVPVTSADILFTIELLRDPQMPIADDVRALWNLVEVTAFDERTLQFVFPDPFVPFTDYLDFGVLPEHILGGKNVQELIDAPFNLDPVGSGPYQFEELLIEDGHVVGVVLTAYDDYYLDRAFIDQIAFRYFNSTADALDAYREDQIMGIAQVQAESLRDILSEPDLSVYTARLPQMTMVLLNLNNAEVPYFQDINIRKALLFSINRPWMITEVLDGQAVVADGPIFPGSWAYYGDVTTIEFSPDTAVSMLREAGFVIPTDGGDARAKEGVHLQFELVHPDTPEHAILASMIQDYWAEVGVEVSLVAVDYQSLITDYLETGNYQAALVDLNLSGSPDPDPYPFWHQAQATGGQNYSGWDDRRASEYLEQARVTPNINERMRLYRNFQVHFSRELPALPLFYPVYNYAVSSQVQGLSLGPIYNTSDRFNNIVEWFLISSPDAVVVETPEE